jgi:hypothetical protein
MSIGEVGDRADAVLADGEGHGAERADRGSLHQDGDEAEDRGCESGQEVGDRLALVADHAERDAEQDREEQHLQDVALCKGADDGFRDDVHQEAGNRRFMRLGGVGGDGLAIERCRIDVHAGAGMQDVADDQADDQRQRRENDEIEHRLASDAADLFQVRHAGNAGGDGEEDDRRDDHLDEADEGIAERLQAGAEIRPEMADQHAGDDGTDDLEIQVPIEW